MYIHAWTGVGTFYFFSESFPYRYAMVYGILRPHVRTDGLGFGMVFASGLVCALFVATATDLVAIHP